MNHYRHHIGDYRKDTAHLSLLEHGIYRQALDLYYLEEQPLPSDLGRLMRLLCVRNADEERSLCAVLADFFVLTDEGYVHARCERELEAIYAKSDKARESAMKRWSAKKQPVSGKKKRDNANAMRTHSERNANGMLPSNPVPSNPVPKEKTARGAEIDLSKLPQALSSCVWTDYWQWRTQNKYPTNQHVVNRIASQLQQCEEAGYPPDDALVTAMERGWRTVKLNWLENENAKSTRTGSNGSRARQVADRLDSIVRDGLPEERTERMGGGDLPEAAGGVRGALDGEYRRH